MKIQNKIFSSLNLPEIGIVEFIDGIAEVDDKFAEICEKLASDKIIKIVRLVEGVENIEVSKAVNEPTENNDQEEDLLSIGSLSKLTHQQLIEIGEAHLSSEVFEGVKNNKKALIANILKFSKKESK
jgi:hypothetical protein